MLDLNKRVYNHIPGPCRTLQGIDQGAEDMELLADGTVVITSVGVFIIINNMLLLEIIDLISNEQRQWNIINIPISKQKSITSYFRSIIIKIGLWCSKTRLIQYSSWATNV